MLALSDSQTEDCIWVISGTACGITDVSSPGFWKAAIAVAQWIEQLVFSVELCECASMWVCAWEGLRCQIRITNMYFLFCQTHKSLSRYHTQKSEQWLFSI